MRSPANPKQRPPLEVVAFLNAMFSTFDRILDKYGVRKIEELKVSDLSIAEDVELLKRQLQG